MSDKRTCEHSGAILGSNAPDTFAREVSDAAAELCQFCYCPGPTCSGCGPMIKKLFTAGANWGFAFVRLRMAETLVKLTVERDEARAMCAKLAEALEFYARHHHHMKTTSPNFARKALAEYEAYVKGAE